MARTSCFPPSLFPFPLIYTENCWPGFRSVLNLGNSFRLHLSCVAVYASFSINTGKYYISDHCPHALLVIHSNSWTRTFTTYWGKKQTVLQLKLPISTLANKEFGGKHGTADKAFFKRCLHKAKAKVFQLIC